MVHSPRRIAILPYQTGHVYPGHRILGNRPRRRDPPRAAVIQTYTPVDRTRRLLLWQRHRRLHGRHQPSPSTVVIPHATNIDPVVSRVRINLELRPVTKVVTNVGRKPLDRQISGTVDVPFRRRIPRLTVLRNNPVGGFDAWISRLRRRRLTRQRQHDPPTNQPTHPAALFFPHLCPRSTLSPSIEPSGTDHAPSLLTVTTELTGPIRPLSSTARLKIPPCETSSGMCQAYCHSSVPVAGCHVAPVDRHLYSCDNATLVDCGSLNCDNLCHHGTVLRFHNLRQWSRRILRRLGWYQFSLQTSWLHPHIGKQIHRRLLYRRDGTHRIWSHSPTIRIRPVVMQAVKSPGVLDTSGTEHQRAARRAIQCHMVCRASRVVKGPPVLHVRQIVNRGFRQANQAGWSDSVVDILIPLVSKNSTTKHGPVAVAKGRDLCVSPEPSLSITGGHLDSIIAEPSHRGDGANELA